MDLKYKIVRRLLRDDEVGFSRNKNFDAYEDPAVQQALRIYHHLESVESDLLEFGPAGNVVLDAVDRDADQTVAVRLTFADDDTRRVTYLDPGEWQILVEDERVASVLGDLLDETDPETRTMLENALEVPN